MYFGDFLVSKKVINEDQLLTALVHQVESLPSFLRVLQEEKIFSTIEIFKMIQTQFEEQSDLVNVLKNHYNFEEGQIQKLYQKQLKNRKLLGSILVELKLTEQSVIETMLFEFLRDKENISKKAFHQVEQTAPVTLDPQKNQAAAEVEISEAALESLRELGLSDEDFKPKVQVQVEVVVENENIEGNVFVEEYLNIYSEKQNNKLIKLIDILHSSLNDDSDITNYLNSLYLDLLTLKGASLLGELVHSCDLLEAWRVLIEDQMKQSSELIKKWSVNALPLLSESANLLWELRAGIARSKNENFVNESNQIHGKLKKLMEELTFLH